jgi:hypothetical protein
MHAKAEAPIIKLTVADVIHVSEGLYSHKNLPKNYFITVKKA